MKVSNTLNSVFFGVLDDILQPSVWHTTSGIDDLDGSTSTPNCMVPQPLYGNGRITAGLAGIAPVAWAVTKAKKKEYDRVFEAYDELNVGLIEHDIAIEAIGQSYLPIMELEKIYALVDQENKGKIYMHQFAVAMHLIRRIIKGYALPNHLSPELVTPWVKKFLDSIGNAESSMFQDGQQHQTRTNYLGNCPFRMESEEKIKHLTYITNTKRCQHKSINVGYVPRPGTRASRLTWHIIYAAGVSIGSWKIAYGYSPAPAV